MITHEARRHSEDEIETKLSISAWRLLLAITLEFRQNDSAHRQSPLRPSICEVHGHWHRNARISGQIFGPDADDA